MSNLNNIHVEHGYEKGAHTYYPVLIVGAGPSGIAMGCQLKEQLGCDQFRIFDRQSGIGGTWWINRYPGVACDVPGIYYSFSFSPNVKSSTFYPTGPEMARYLQSTCDKYQISDKVQLNTDVSELKWMEDEELWQVTLIHMAPGTGDLSEKERQQRIADYGEKSVYLFRETVRAKVVASAVGSLVEPKGWPEHIPGRKEFQGDIFHSARWNESIEFNGKNVVVIGTGCSAAQFVPLLTKAPYNANSVTQVMRSPPWVAPKAGPPQEVWEKFSTKVLAKFPLVTRFLRFLLFLLSEYENFTTFKMSSSNRKNRKEIEGRLMKHMKTTVPEKYHEILTPDYGYGCKRRVLDTWFSNMDDPKFHLTTQSLKSIQSTSVTLNVQRTYPTHKSMHAESPLDDVTIPADVIVLANGFDVTTWLHPLKVRGKGGKLLQDVWDERGGAQAYLGAAMDGFPNFFIIFGPNVATGHASVILATENMVNYSLHFMKPLLNGDVKTFEVKKQAELDWTKKMQDELRNTVWQDGGCNSWYKTEDGWNSTRYP